MTKIDKSWIEDSWYNYGDIINTVLFAFSVVALFMVWLKLRKI